MPRSLEYREVIRRLKQVRPGLQVATRRGKGSHRMVYDPDLGRHYPLPHGGDDKRRINAGMLKDLIRILDLPRDTFD